MTSRYDDRDIGTNRHPQYKNLIKDRGIKHLRQYLSPNLVYPTESDVVDLELIGHIWTVGDRYFKLANRYYGDPKLWWVIAWFNQKPTEAHLNIGDILNIPLPLDRVLRLLEI